MCLKLSIMNFRFYQFLAPEKATLCLHIQEDFRADFCSSCNTIVLCCKHDCIKYVKLQA